MIMVVISVGWWILNFSGGSIYVVICSSLTWKSQDIFQVIDNCVYGLREFWQPVWLQLPSKINSQGQARQNHESSYSVKYMSFRIPQPFSNSASEPLHVFSKDSYSGVEDSFLNYLLSSVVVVFTLFNSSKFSWNTDTKLTLHCSLDLHALGVKTLCLSSLFICCASFDHYSHHGHVE